MADHLRLAEESFLLRSPGEERRASVRRPSSLRVGCRLLTEGEGSCEARVRDASPLGVGLLLPRPPGPGALLRLDCEEATQGALAAALVRVVHVSRRAGG
jgi:hypothetical protein